MKVHTLVVRKNACDVIIVIRLNLDRVACACAVFLILQLCSAEASKYALGLTSSKEKEGACTVGVQPWGTLLQSSARH